MADDTSSCASSAASTPLMSNKPLAPNVPLTIRLPPPSPVIVTASPPGLHWRAPEPRQQGDEDDFRPPGLGCYSPKPTESRRGTATAQSRRPFAGVEATNEFVKVGDSPGDKSKLSREVESQSGRATTANRSRASRARPYDPTGALPPLKEALYTASRLKLAPRTGREQGVPVLNKADSRSTQSSDLFPKSELDDRVANIKVLGGPSAGKLDLVPINPTSAPLPSPVPAHALPVIQDSSIPASTSPSVQNPRGSGPYAASPWVSIPASIPPQVTFPDQSNAPSFPRSYPHLPQWQRLESLRTDYASNAYAAKTSSLEIHARDYRAGILLLSLLDVLHDRQKLVNERVIDIQRMTWNVMEMQEMGCSWSEMGVVEAHASANEFFKAIWGCEFKDVPLEEDGPISIDAIKNLLELKEDGASGANLPVGHIPSYPDGVHLPSLDRLIGIPMRRADQRLGEFDIQRMGRAFAEAPFDVLKSLVHGVDGSKYAPLEI